MDAASSQQRFFSLLKKVSAWITCLSLAPAIILIMGGADAHAQSMDYGALEQLFGEPVTTSATGSPQRASDAPVDMTIVTAEDIRRSGARDIPGVLRHVGGVDVLQWTNDHADVGLGGYDEAYNHRVLVLVDGRQVYADLYAYTPWVSVPVELGAIRQIEIVKGPASALFGFNAVDGVINIVTYNPLYDDVKVVSATAGTQDIRQGSTVTTFKAGDVGMRLMAGGFHDHDFTTPIPPLVYLKPRYLGTRGSFDTDAVWEATEKVHVELSANYNRSRVDEIDPGYLEEPAKYRTYSFRGRISADTGATGLMELSAYFNRVTVEYKPDPFFGNFRHDNRLVVLQAQDLFKLGSDHTLRASAEYRHSELPTTPYVGGRVATSIISAGGMWEWKIAPTFTLTNAARLDHLKLNRTGSVPLDYPFTNADWNRALNQISFNSGLVWQPDALNTVRLSVGRSARTPSLNDIGGILIDTPFFLFTGRPTLNPSTNMKYEIGWDRALPTLNAKARATIFYEENRDVISLQGGSFQTPNGVVRTQLNAGTSRAAGAEVGLSGNFLADWRWGLDLRYESIKDKFAPETQFLDFEHVAPKFIAKVNLGWSHGPWEVDGFLHVQSHTQVLQMSPDLTSMLVDMPSYAALDARIAYKVTDRLTLAVSGQNLSSATQRQTSGPPIERRVLGTVTYAWH